MFCPKCRAEYEKGFTSCSDCHPPLAGIKIGDVANLDNLGRPRESMEGGRGSFLSDAAGTEKGTGLESCDI